MKRNAICLILTLVLSLTLNLTACGFGAAKRNSSTSEGPMNTDYVVYEAVFVNNEQISSIFNEVRGEPPYPKITADYHVTTAFRPEVDARALYGKEVTVKIIGYKAGEVTTDDGGTTMNEGFKVELVTDDAELTDYVVGKARNYHITGSYVDQAKYTGYLDFSDATPVDYTVKGTFGAYLSNGRITFTADNVGQ